MAQIPDNVKAFLDKPNVAVLATISPSGNPQATPIWFMVEDGHILVNTARGRVKLRNMETNPRVVLTVVDQADPYQYVQIRGLVARFDRVNAARDIDRLAMRYHGMPFTYRRDAGPESRVSILIRPDRISANLR